jgi:hypothetical protein
MAGTQHSSNGDTSKQQDQQGTSNSQHPGTQHAANSTSSSGTRHISDAVGLRHAKPNKAPQQQQKQQQQHAAAAVAPFTGSSLPVGMQHEQHRPARPQQQQFPSTAAASAVAPHATDAAAKPAVAPTAADKHSSSNSSSDKPPEEQQKQDSSGSAHSASAAAVAAATAGAIPTSNLGDVSSAYQLLRMECISQTETGRLLAMLGIAWRVSAAAFISYLVLRFQPLPVSSSGSTGGGSSGAKWFFCSVHFSTVNLAVAAVLLPCATAMLVWMAFRCIDSLTSHKLWSQRRRRVVILHGVQLLAAAIGMACY